MASVFLSQSSPRVSPVLAILLGMVSDVDSYWSRQALGQTFNEMQMQLSEDERSAFHLIHKGLHRLFPFDPDRDHPTAIIPRHAI